MKPQTTDNYIQEQVWAYEQQIKILRVSRKSSLFVKDFNLKYWFQQICWPTTVLHFSDAKGQKLAISYLQSQIWNQSSNLLWNRFCRSSWFKLWVWMLTSIFFFKKKKFWEHSQNWHSKSIILVQYFIP